MDLDAFNIAVFCWTDEARPQVPVDDAGWRYRAAEEPPKNRTSAIGGRSRGGRPGGDRASQLAGVTGSSA